MSAITLKNQRIQKIRLAVFALSTILFPVTFYYLSPVIPFAGSADGIATGSLFLFVLLFLSSIVLGRSFCSWICPAGGIQDQVGTFRTKTVAVSKIAWMKYVVWTVWLAMLLFSFRRAGGINSIQVGFATEMGLSTTSIQALISYTVVVLVFFLLSTMFGRRTGCHTLCWMAPFMVLGRKIGLAVRIPSLHLATVPTSCVSCGRCTANCPMSLNVQELVKKGEITDDNCILCGRCIGSCRKDTIDWAWRRSK